MESWKINQTSHNLLLMWYIVRVSKCLTTSGVQANAYPTKDDFNQSKRQIYIGWN